MDFLPTEIVEMILANPRLTVEDVLNFGAMSQHFHSIVHDSNYIWKKKFELKWPQFMKHFDSDFNDWLNETHYVYDLSRRTHASLSAMSPRFFRNSQLSDCDFTEWSELVRESPRAYHYMVFDLMTIVRTSAPIHSIEVVPVDTPGNKTLQYYASKVVRFIRQVRLADEWRKFVTRPSGDQILEKGAVFVAQWCQPARNIEWEDIAAQLDGLASEVRMCLKLSYPDHPLHKVSEETLEEWKLHNLDRNQWNATECRQLMRCLVSVMYEQNKFSGNSDRYYMLENSYINEVLLKRKGLPITLAIVFESVARRVGLKCEPISFPAHFLLRFTEGQSENRLDSYYIDVFNKGNVVRKGACPHSQRHTEDGETYLLPATVRQVVERMANNIEVSCRQHVHPTGNLTQLRSALELLHLVSPNDLSAVISLGRIYMLHNIDTKPLANYLMTHVTWSFEEEQMFQNYSNYLQEFAASEQVDRVIHMLNDYDLHHQQDFCQPLTQAEPKARPINLKFAVGMVMRHLVLNYLCVICDWDPVCMASTEWQLQMGVHRLKKRDQQPFYNVLVEDGSHRYVAQENMMASPKIGLLNMNEDIGRHFSHYFETHYVPNAEKEKEFPGDRQVRHKYHQKLIFGRQ